MEDHPEDYAALKSLWLRVCDRDAGIMTRANAANFFADREPALSDQLLWKAIQEQPNNWLCVDRLIDLYKQIVDSAQQPSSQGSYRLNPDRVFFLANLLCGSEQTPGHGARFLKIAEVLYALQESSAAEQCAEVALDSLIDSERDIEDVRYNSHQLLGRIALRLGRISEATDHLGWSLNVSPSPVLQSFGPSLTLAQELLDVGERISVIEYLERCASFWKGKPALFEQWIAEIKEGLTPRLRSW
jgi:tetratricopeptide (TPR) repeat protein